jgi:hypothetical protein
LSILVRSIVDHFLLAGKAVGSNRIASMAETTAYLPGFGRSFDASSPCTIPDDRVRRNDPASIPGNCIICRF